ncbi:hypothetical protein RCL1_006273 [Eukaryota sp. TZLM3-RCL]
MSIWNAFIVFCLLSFCFARNIYWVNPGSGDFTVLSNWRLDKVTAITSFLTSDNLFIELNGSAVPPVITLSIIGHLSFASITLGSPSGGSFPPILTVNNPASLEVDNFIFRGGTLSGNGLVNFHKLTLTSTFPKKIGFQTRLKVLSEIYYDATTILFMSQLSTLEVSPTSDVIISCPFDSNNTLTLATSATISRPLFLVLGTMRITSSSHVILHMDMENSGQIFMQDYAIFELLDNLINYHQFHVDLNAILIVASTTFNHQTTSSEEELSVGLITHYNTRFEDNSYVSGGKRFLRNLINPAKFNGEYSNAASYVYSDGWWIFNGNQHINTFLASSDIPVTSSFVMEVQFDDLPPGQVGGMGISGMFLCPFYC